jgi:hypothetical protein
MDLSAKNNLTQRGLLLNIWWEPTYLDHWQAIVRYTYKNINAGFSNYLLVAWRRVGFLASFSSDKNKEINTTWFIWKKTLSFSQWKLHVSSFSRWSSGYSYESIHHCLYFYKNSRMVTCYRARYWVFIVRNKYFSQINQAMLDCWPFIENNSL